MISAGDALSSTYGVTMASTLGFSSTTGFKFIPWFFQDFATAAAVMYRLSATQAGAGDDSVAIFGTESTGAAGGSGTAGSAAFSGAVHFIFGGFIASVPFGFR